LAISELANLCDYLDPDVIILTETKLDSTINYTEFLPKNYKGDIRKDRVKGGGGVMIAYKTHLVAVEVELPNVEAETIWARIVQHDGSSILVGAYYRTPSDRTTCTIEVLDSVLNDFDERSPIILGGDFNAGDIDWEHNSVAAGSDRKALCEKLIEVLENHDLEQLQREPTRNNAVLDLYCTNRPNLVKCISTVPGISDHDIVVVDSDIKAQINKKPKRQVHQWSKANWDLLREDSLKFQESFLKDYQNHDIDTNYNKFCKHVEDITKQHVPTKPSSSSKKIPWLTPHLKRLTRKKQRLYNRAKKSHKDLHWAQYKSLKSALTKALRKARWDYINGILQLGLDEGNTKPFWRYVYSQKNDRSGVAPLREDGRLHSDGQRKATILNKQFVSVFTRDKPGCETTLSGPSYPPIKTLEINTKGVHKLLAGINPSKAAGPDQVPCRILKELASELAPILSAIFNQSLNDGTLPKHWLDAHVAPVFKKGQSCLPENYRPVSLTCVTCKLLEHIICTHIRGHMDMYGILSPFQHGFRTRHSCETQLLVTLNDLFVSRDKGTQIDCAVLDFSKAFDKVPHKRLVSKLRLYGIDDPVRRWIQAFLTGRTQCVRVDGEFSSSSDVTSGVPQGTVLGPLLFLIFINDLPTVLNSDTKCRLFADDCLIYRQIHSISDQIKLQNDLDSLLEWSHTWGMHFNAKKCNIMSVARTTPLSKFYQLGDSVLDHVDMCTYLGINISNNMSWSRHINQVVKKANSRLGFLRRNLRGCPLKLKRTAFVTLVRSQVEYGSTVWDPHLVKDREALERVQRKAARWVANNYSYRSSVTSILRDLGLEPLEDRRKNARLTMMYKIVHDIVAVSPTDIGLQLADTRTRASHRYKFRHLGAKTTEHLNSFSVKTIKDWNNLPACMAEAGTLDIFKCQLTPSFK
jgi:hypothetical protein